VGNITITGGNVGEVLTTDGNGVLSWSEVTGSSNSAAPMPYLIPVGESYIVPNNFQGLFYEPIDIEGEFEVEGILIDVSGATPGGGGTPGGSTTQVQYNNNGSFAGSASLVFDNTTNTLTACNFSVTSVANLGNVSNVKISGGVANYVLKTDGLGNLSWGEQTASGTPGGSPSQVQFNGNGTFSGNPGLVFDSVTTTLTACNFAVINAANLGNVENVTILGGGPNYVLKTDGFGNLSWSSVTGGGGTPGGFNTYVQFNDAGSFGGSGNFVFNKTTDTLSVSNINVSGNANALSFTNGDGNSVKFAVPNTSSNVTFVVPNAAGTQQQVLGVTDQATQQLGWKTVPTYYIEIDMRDSDNFYAPPNPVLRVYPVRTRAGTFIDLAVTS